MKRILIEQDKCNGCKNCSIACMQAHRTDKGSIYDLNLLDPKNEARHTITTNSKANSKAVSLADCYGGYVPVFCRHCAEPECVKACMSGALKKDSLSGHVQYDEKRCGACFMCVMSCPYGNIKPDRVSRSKVIKCDFCKGQNGPDDNGDPNCVKSCHRKALRIAEVWGGV